jgi:hypothetical protein
MGSFQIKVAGQSVDVKLVGHLSGSDFESAQVALEKLPQGANATVDLTAAAYVDAFEMLVFKSLLDRVATCTFRCQGHVREALELTLEGDPKVSYEDP